MVKVIGPPGGRVAAHKKHRFARLREVPVSEVARQPILAFSRDEYPGYQVLLTQLFLPYTLAIKIVAEYQSLESIIAGVEAGRGVAIVYQSMSCISGKRLALRPLKLANRDRLPQRARFSDGRCRSWRLQEQQN